MNVNDMVAALVAKTVDAMVNVEPYNQIAVADGIGTLIMDFSSVDRMPVFMAATSTSSTRTPTPSSPISRPGGMWRRLQEQPGQGRRRDLFVLHLQGLLDVA